MRKLIPEQKQLAVKTKAGFTLVELSIVLVIIGLLIGGILVGQSLIESAKVNATAQQIQQFDAGVMAFKSKYKSLPGDAPAFGGDGDRLIDLGPYYGSNYVASYGCEIADFWNNVFPSVYVKSAPPACGSIFDAGVRTYTQGVNINVPKAKLGKSGSYFIAASSAIIGSEVANTTTMSNYYAILDPGQLQSLWGSYYRMLMTNNTNSAVQPTALLALDQKLDDGKPNAGYVLSGRIGDSNGSGYGGIEPLATSGFCSSGSSYAVASAEYECTPLIRIGSIAGIPQ